MQEFFPLAYINFESKAEIHIIIPPLERHKEMYINLFDTLEKEKNNLHIHSYGIKDSSLEDILAKVMEEQEIVNEGMYPLFFCKVEKMTRYIVYRLI